VSPFELIRAEAASSSQSNKSHLSISRFCCLLKVSTSGYYDWKARQRMSSVAGTQSKEGLVSKIRAIQEEVGWVYGSRRLRCELLAHGETIGRRAVRRVIKENELFPVQKKRFKRTTDSEHELGYSMNILEKKISTKAPDEAWVSDITYIWTGEGWSYLATVIDLYSRKVVGWAIADNMKSSLVVKALTRALVKRAPRVGLIVHTDRGSQYASAAYRKILRDKGILQSMSGAGNCYDNAVAESFFASLKKESVSRQHFATRTEAFDVINRYIEDFYNQKRLYSALGYMSPIDYELTMRLPAAA
jgi:putative transposase